jgi:hypothetical protein
MQVSICCVPQSVVLLYRMTAYDWLNADYYINSSSSSSMQSEEECVIDDDYTAVITNSIAP